MRTLLPPSVKCPATGFKKSCCDIVSKHDCPKWVQYSGKHPDTGERIDEWGCADTFVPILLHAIAKETSQLSASVDGLRNATGAVVALIATQNQELKAIK